MPFICLRRTDIPNSILQITDLWPNKSQYNVVIDPPAVGPRYISAPTTETVVVTNVGGLITFTAAKTGLAAYLMANVQALGVAGIALTPTQANVAAAAIIAAMRAGTAMTLVNINVILVAAVGALTELTGVGGTLSTGTVMDVLRILSGVTYTVPAATRIQIAAGPVFSAQATPAVWNAANFDSDILDILPTDNAFYLSLNAGKIAGFKAATFTYLSVAGAALTVYDNSGGAY